MATRADTGAMPIHLGLSSSPKAPLDVVMKGRYYGIAQDLSSGDSAVSAWKDLTTI